MTDAIMRLPMPERLEPKNAKRSLSQSVRVYFYALYNATDGTFRDLLASVGNKDAITGNRLFDRHKAVGMIKEQAAEAKDSITMEAKDGDVYRCLVNIMNNHDDLSLRQRRISYDKWDHQQAAE
jgi:hypothetical protein